MNFSWLGFPSQLKFSLVSIIIYVQLMCSILYVRIVLSYGYIPVLIHNSVQMLHVDNSDPADVTSSASL